MSNVGYATLQIIPSTKGIASALSGGISGPMEAEGAKAGDSAAGGFASTFTKGLGGIGKVAFLGVATGIGAVVAAGIGLAKIGEDFDSAFDTIRTSTGATGDQLSALEESFKTTFASVPVSMEDAATAVSDVTKRLGLTGAPLEDLSKQFLNLSRVTETDLGTNIENVSQLFTNFGVAASDQGAKLDELFRASQATGLSVSDLAAGMTSVGPVARSVGLDFDTTAALLGTLNKAGVDAGAVMPALSKSIATAAKDGKSAQDVFTSTFDAIRAAPDATAAAGVAIETFGTKAGPKLADLIRSGALSYEDLLATIQGGTETINTAAEDTDDWREKLKLLGNKALVALQPLAAKVFDGVTKGIIAATPYIESFATWLGENLPKAIDAVTQWVQRNWPTIKAVIVTAVDGIKAAIAFLSDVILPAVVAGFDAVVSWIRTNWPGIRDTVVGVFQAIIDGWATYGQPAIDAIIAGVSWVVTYIQDHWAAISETANDVWTAVSAYVEFALGAIKVIVEGYVVAIQWIWDNFGTYIIAAAQLAWDTIHGIIEVGINIIRGIIKTVTGLITGDWGKAWDGIKQILDGVWEGIKNTISTTLSVITLAISAAWTGVAIIAAAIWGAIKSVIQGVWDGIVGLIGGALQWIGDTVASVFGTIAVIVGPLWNAAKNAIKGPVDAIVGIIDAISSAIQTAIGWIRNLVDAIKSIPSPGDVVSGIGNFVGGHLPFFARGAIVSSPTLGVFGDAGTEALIPVNDEPRARYLMRASGLDRLVQNDTPAVAGGGPVMHVEGNIIGDEAFRRMVRTELQAVAFQAARPTTRVA